MRFRAEKGNGSMPDVHLEAESYEEAMDMLLDWLGWWLVSEEEEPARGSSGRGATGAAPGSSLAARVLEGGE